MTINEASNALNLCNDVPDPDRTWALGKSDASSAPLHRIDITRSHQPLHRFLQVMCGNAEYTSDVGRSYQILRSSDGKIHHEPQRQVSMKSKAHPLHP